MKETILLTGGSGLLSLNFAVKAKKSYRVVLGLNNKIINLKNTSTYILNLNSEEKTIDDFKIINPKIIIHNAGIT